MERAANSSRRLTVCGLSCTAIARVLRVVFNSKQNDAHKPAEIKSPIHHFRARKKRVPSPILLLYHMAAHDRTTRLSPAERTHPYQRPFARTGGGVDAPRPGEENGSGGGGRQNPRKARARVGGHGVITRQGLLAIVLSARVGQFLGPIAPCGASRRGRLSVV